MNENHKTLWRQIRGNKGERLVFLITTGVIFLVVYVTIANSGQYLEPATCIIPAIFSLSAGVLAAGIASCIGDRDARLKTWNEPRRFFLFVMIVCFIIVCLIIVGSILAFSIHKRHPEPLVILSGIFPAFVFFLSLFGFILALIPWTRPLMYWVLRRRFFVLASIVTIIALAYSGESWRGKRAWENYKQAQAAKGEYFDFAHIIPPPVQDDQNFALTPLLKPAFDYTLDNNGESVWRDTNALARLRHIGQDALPLKKGDDKIHPDLGDLFKGTLADLDKWQAYFQGNTNFPQAATTASRAEKILVALNLYQPELDELQQAADTRPFSRFAIKYDSEPAWGILLPHLGEMKGLTRLACVRSIARLDAGQTDGAFADLKLGFRLSDSIKDEPILIDHLVRLATLDIPLQSLREGLARHAWSDAQLSEIETNLAAINLLAELKQALRGERIFNVAGLDWMRRQGLKAKPAELATLANGDGNTATANALNLMPSSFYYFNMLTIAQAEELSFSGFDEIAHRVFPGKTGLEGKVIGELPGGFHPYTMFARMIVPALSRCTVKSSRLQAYVDLARIACALERYRLAHREYPKTLDALAPQLIAELPHDPINGEPLHYLHNGDGYTLYSVGWNEKDDGGTIVFGKGKTPAVDPEQGDWVWQSVAKSQ